jgi:hypothetical protein
MISVRLVICSCTIKTELVICSRNKKLQTFALFTNSLFCEPSRGGGKGEGRRSGQRRKRGTKRKGERAYHRANDRKCLVFRVLRLQCLWAVWRWQRTLRLPQRPPPAGICGGKFFRFRKDPFRAGPAVAAPLCWVCALRHPGVDVCC